MALASAHALVKLAEVMGQGLPADSAVAVHAGRVVTWAHFQADVGAMVRALDEAPRERKAVLYSTDAYPFAVGLMALWHRGLTVCLPGHLGGVPAGETSLWVGEGGIPIALGAQASPSNHEALKARPSNHQPALIVFTSGSTGAPMAVEKKFSQIDSELATLERTFGATFGDALILGTATQQHLYGFLFRVAWPLAAGRTFVSEASLFPEKWFDETAKHPRVAWVSSPAFYRRLWADLPWASVAGKVVAACSSGGVLADEVGSNINRWLRQPIVEIFGSSETGGVATRRNQEPWRAFAGVEIQRRDDGALLVRSPHLPVATELFVMDDAVELQGDAFQLLGRMDRVVKVEDKRVSLADLEASLLESPLVTDAKAVLLDTGARHEIGAVVVLSLPGQTFMNDHGRLALTAALKKTLPAHLPVVANIRRFRFVNALPANSMGKVTQASLVELLTTARATMPRVLEAKTTAAGMELTLDIEPDLAALDGHFPEAPVVPGVAQLDWAVRLARRYLPVPATGFSKLEAVKFHRVIQPGVTVQLSLEWSVPKQRLIFSYASPKGPCSSGRVVLNAPSRS